MAMDANRLGDALKAACTLTGPVDDAARTALFRAMAAAIIAEITAHAQVTSTVTVASVAGVTVGAGTSGPGTGSATGTVS